MTLDKKKALTTLLELSKTAHERELSEEELAKMNEILEASDGLDELLGARYDKVAPQEIVMKLRIEAKHLQPWGVTNGGVYASLGETAASMASYIAAGAGPIVMGTNNNTDFLRPSRQGDTIISSATPEHLGRSAHLWRVEHRNERTGKILALTSLKTAVM